MPVFWTRGEHGSEHTCNHIEVPIGIGQLFCIPLLEGRLEITSGDCSTLALTQPSFHSSGMPRGARMLFSCGSVILIIRILRKDRFGFRDQLSHKFGWVGITSSNGELDPRSPNGAFFRESLPYPVPPTAAIIERWGFRDAATLSRTFKRIGGPPPSEFRRRLAFRRGRCLFLFASRQ
jgi:AraC-like DNA-binding protein